MRRQPVFVRRKRPRTRSSAGYDDTHVAIAVGALMLSLVFFAIVLTFRVGEVQRTETAASAPSSVAISPSAPSSEAPAVAASSQAANSERPEAAFGGGRGLAEPGTSRVRDAIEGNSAGNDKIEMEPLEERYVSMGRKQSADSGLPTAIRETLGSACAPCREAHFEAYREAMHAKRGASVLGRAKATKGVAIDAYREAFRKYRNRGAGERCCAHGDRWAR